MKTETQKSSEGRQQNQARPKPDPVNWHVSCTQKLLVNHFTDLMQVFFYFLKNLSHRPH